MAYCDLGDLKTYLGITSDTDNTLLSSCISRATAIIDAHCARTFEASGSTTKYFDARADVDGRVLWLGGHDLCSITSITNGDGAVVASDAYTTEPRGETPYYAVRLLGSGGVSWTYADDPENAIAISGKWAYSASAPADITHACIRLSAFLYRQKDNQGGDLDRPVVVGDGVTLLPARIPADIAELLSPYRRRV